VTSHATQGPGSGGSGGRASSAPQWAWATPAAGRVSSFEIISGIDIGDIHDGMCMNLCSEKACGPGAWVPGCWGKKRRRIRGADLFAVRTPFRRSFRIVQTFSSSPLPKKYDQQRVLAQHSTQQGDGRRPRRPRRRGRRRIAAWADPPAARRGMWCPAGGGRWRGSPASSLPARGARCRPFDGVQFLSPVSILLNLKNSNFDSLAVGTRRYCLTDTSGGVAGDEVDAPIRAGGQPRAVRAGRPPHHLGGPRAVRRLDVWWWWKP